jgi:ABC-2 type transport system ATP-binding protein
MSAQQKEAWAIQARGLVKTYPGGVRALDGFDLSVEQGSVFGLLGPNGAGKSTTVKILTTLSRPDEGAARVAGLDVLTEPSRVRDVIGVVAQRSGVDREATGRENLVLQARIHGSEGRRCRQRVEELLERFGLAEAADRLARTYSGGTQRRLDIAMGLVQEPRVLFLDEPTTGLDPEARAGLWGEIERLSRDEGLTVLLTTHYLEEADQLAKRLAIVDRGRVVVEGAPEELKSELHGDAIQIELSQAASNGHFAGSLEHVPGIAEIALEGRTLRARAKSGATAVPAVLAALDAAGAAVTSVTVARPSLDDVYLRHTGRTFRDEDKEENR